MAKAGHLQRCVALLLVALASACASPADRYIAGFTKAERAVTPFRSASSWIPGLTEADAYRLQHRIVSRRLAHGDVIAGFKGGLVSQESMDGKHVARPLIAPLYRSGAAASGAVISLQAYRKAVHEAKIGFIAGTRIAAPVASIAALRPLIAGVLPVVDLPDISYANPNAYGAMDMIAANISAARYVTGTAYPPASVDPDAIEMTLSRDGKPVTHGAGSESLKGQWTSLLILVNLAVEQGYVIQPGQVIITGKIGAKADLLPGRYRADYGPLGVVTFTVEP